MCFITAERGGVAMAKGLERRRRSVLPSARANGDLTRRRPGHFIKKEESRRVVRMAQRLRMSARNPEILGSIPRDGGR